MILKCEKKSRQPPPSDPSAPPKDPKAPSPRTLPRPEAPETPLSPRRTPLSWERSSAMGSMVSLSRSLSRSLDEPELEAELLPEGARPLPVDLWAK